MSALLCFGAGVLLAVSMLHMLPEAHDGLPDLAELSFCIGFLLLYLIDEVVHFFCAYHSPIQEAQGRTSGLKYLASVMPSSLKKSSEKQQQDMLYDQNSFESNSSIDSNGTAVQYGNRLNSKHPRRFSGGSMSPEPQDGDKAKVSSYSQLLNKNDKPSTSYGSISTTERNIVDVERDVGSSHEDDRLQRTSTSAGRPANLKQLNLASSSTYSVIQIPQRRRDAMTSLHCSHTQQEQYVTDFDMLCHTNYSPPCPKSRAGYIGLFIALTIHSMLEGAAVGLKPSAEQMLLLMGAIACHKVVVAFCYGLELRASGSGYLSVCGQIFLFSLGSVLGIMLSGVLAEDEHVHIITGPAVSIIQVCDFSELLSMELNSHLRFLFEQLIESFN
jgi:zinc transporter ZupT